MAGGGTLEHFAASVACVRELRSTNLGADDICGAGFLIDRRHVISCAHVVNRALLRDSGEDACPAGLVLVELPFIAAAAIPARVVEWHPMLAYRRRDVRQLSDMAVLRLESDAPAEAIMARLGEVWRNGGQSVRCFGFPARSGLAGEIADAVTIAEDATGWLHLRQAPGSGPAIAEGYSGTPIFDAATGLVIGMISAFEAGDDPRQGRLAYGLASGQLQLAWPALARPYKGLARFERSDAMYFFGRERVMEELRRRVGREHLVMILGPSGGGKSSLVHGGLLPLLDERPPETLWRIASMRPGIDPLANLAGAVVRALGDDSEAGRMMEMAEALVRRLERGDGVRMLARLVEMVRYKAPPNAACPVRLLLVVDAFEELFSLCADGKAREAFIGLIGAIGRQRGEGVVAMIGTMRADYTGELLHDANLSAALDGHYLMLRAMKGAELGRAIRLPAQRLGVRFEAGVDDDLLVAVARDPAALPLMEFVLERLWADQQDRVLTRAAYDRMGGLGGALALHADEILSAMDEGEQALARRLLCRLVNVAPSGRGEDGKRPQSRGELGEELWQVARRLAGEGIETGSPARLLILSHDDWGCEQCEIVHEALLRFWPRLRGWLDQERSFLRQLAEWQHMAQRWDEEELSERLLRGRDLAAAMAQIDRIEQELPQLLRFVRESEQAAQAEQARRQTDVIWECLAFAGGEVTLEEWEALDRLQASSPMVRRLFLRRLFEVPERARRFCRVPGPVVRAAVGFSQPDADDLAALITTALGPASPAPIIAAALHAAAAIEYPAPELDAENMGEWVDPAALAAWCRAMAARLAPARAAGLLRTILARLAQHNRADAGDLCLAAIGLTMWLPALEAEPLLRSALAIITARPIGEAVSPSPLLLGLSHLARALAMRIDPPSAGALFARLLGMIETARGREVLESLLLVTQALAELLPQDQLSSCTDLLACALDRAALPGRRRALAMIAVAVAQTCRRFCGRPCLRPCQRLGEALLDRARTEMLLRRLWERGRDRSRSEHRGVAAESESEALTLGALVLAAGLDGVWAARVLHRLLEAIDQSRDSGHESGQLPALVAMAQALAPELDADQSDRAFDYALDLLDWTRAPDRQRALASVAQSLTHRLAPARAIAAFGQLQISIEGHNNTAELAALGGLAACLAARLEAPRAARALGHLLTGLESCGLPARSRALGGIAEALARHVETFEAVALGNSILSLLPLVRNDAARVIALGGTLAVLALWLDAGSVETVLGALFAVAANAALLVQDQIPLLARAVRGLGAALPVGPRSIWLDRALVKLGDDGDALLWASLAEALMEAPAIVPDGRLARQALARLLARPALWKDLPGLIAALQRCLPDDVAAPMMRAALLQPRAALEGVGEISA